MDVKQAEYQIDRAKWAALALKMRILTGYPEWEEFRRQMEGLELSWIEHMVEGCPEGYDYARVFLKGMRAGGHSYLESLFGP